MANGLSKKAEREVNDLFLVTNRRFPVSPGGSAYVALGMGRLLRSGSATPEGLARHRLMPGSPEHNRAVDEAVREHQNAGLRIPRPQVVEGMQFGPSSWCNRWPGRPYWWS